MKLLIRNGRAVMAEQPPPGRVQVRRKDTGKVTFVSPKTLKQNPDRYEGPGDRREKIKDQKQTKRERLKVRRKEKARRKQLKQKGKQQIQQREREESWKGIEKDHPKLSPKEQEERKETYMETGVDSGGRSTKAIKWWLQHHGMAPEEEGEPPKSKKLDKKSIQEHFKYGPKPTRKGKCSEGLKAVRITGQGGAPFVICVDPAVYEVER